MTIHSEPGSSPPPVAVEFLTVGGRRIRLLFTRHFRARRYLLRLQPDGSARVTVPRGGSIGEARLFAGRNIPWLERQLAAHAARPPGRKPWLAGTEILFRGELHKIEAGQDGEPGSIRFDGRVFTPAEPGGDARRVLERYLWKLAMKELPPRVLEFAALHQLVVRRITVRNQKSRWGSCSRRGTISLNWRLIQAPPSARDYVILHELMHLRHMNHSSRFWREVENVCPDYDIPRRWLRRHAVLLV